MIIPDKIYDSLAADGRWRALLVLAYFQRHKKRPSYREAARALGMSKSDVLHKLEYLEAKGFYERAAAQTDEKTTPKTRAEPTGGTSAPASGGGAEKYEKFCQWLAGHCPRVAKLPTQLRYDEFITLFEKYDKDKVFRILANMEDRPDLLRKHRSVYRTALNWLERDQKKQ